MPAAEEEDFLDVEDEGDLDDLEQDLMHEMTKYTERLDAAMVHYDTDKPDERCVQRAIADMIRSKGIKCEREAYPCKGSRVRMDLSGVNFIVEVKMTTKKLHETIGQLLYYSEKKDGHKRLFIAVHDYNDFDLFDEVSECDNFCIELVHAHACAFFLDSSLRHDNLLQGYTK